MAHLIVKIMFQVILFSQIFSLGQGQGYTEEFFDGRYKLNWVITGNNTISFTATATTGGWVGFGLSSHPNYTGTYLVVGGVNGIATESPPTPATGPSTLTTPIISTSTDFPPPVTSTLQPDTESTPPSTTSSTGAGSPTHPPVTFPVQTTTTSAPPTTSTTPTAQPPITWPILTTLPPTFTTGTPGPVTFPTIPPTAPKTFGTAIVVKQIEDDSYNRTYTWDLGGAWYEYSGGSWRFMGATEAVVNGLSVTTVKWDRALEIRNSNETTISPYSDVYVIVLYNTRDEIGLDITETGYQKINFFRPVSSASNLGESIFSICSLTFLAHYLLSTYL